MTGSVRTTVGPASTSDWVVPAVEWTSTGATRSYLDQETIVAMPAERYAAARRWWLAPLRTLIVATIPFVHAYDPALGKRRLYEADTAGQYVLLVGDYSEHDLEEEASILVVAPERPTLWFSADSPVRLLPRRAPFISQWSPTEDD